MKIGLTFDLKTEYLKMGFSDEQAGEFDREDTIDAIENTLIELGYQTERIGHAKQLMNLLLEGKRWDLVFNICEGMYGIGREAQVPAILDVFNIPYTFSDTLVSALTLHKGLTKRVIRDCNIPTADFFIVEHIKQVDVINLKYPLFVKPIAEGTGKGIGSYSKITQPDQLKSVCAQLLEKYKQPVLVETFVSGREFTVGITGTGEDAQVVGVCEVILKKDAEDHAYSYFNKENCEELVIYQVTEEVVAQECKKVALDSWKALLCRDGGRVDLKLDENGVPNFLEVNPLSGLHPLHSDLPILATQKGVSYKELIKRIMDSAVKRLMD